MLSIFCSGSMPRRKKPSKADTKAAINGSLREWGVHPGRKGIHAKFLETVTDIAVESAVRGEKGDDLSTRYQRKEKKPSGRSI